MTELKAEIRIAAPKQRVWQTLADLGGIHHFHPGVKDSYYLSDERDGVGASRRCELKPAGQLDERVVEWVEGETLALDIVETRGMPPLRDAGGRFTLSEENGETVVALALRYEVGLGFLGPIIDALMMRRQFERTVPAVLRGLKRHVESGAAPKAA